MLVGYNNSHIMYMLVFFFYTCVYPFFYCFHSYKTHNLSNLSKFIDLCHHLRYLTICKVWIPTIVLEWKCYHDDTIYKLYATTSYVIVRIYSAYTTLSLSYIHSFMSTDALYAHTIHFCHIYLKQKHLVKISCHYSIFVSNN